MASERQLRANRANAAKSTGPKTITGKAISAQNSIVHGLTARHTVLDWEDPAAFEQLRRALHDEFKPVLPSTFELVEHLAALLWRLRRSHRYEAAIVTWITHQQAEVYDAGGVMLGQAFFSADQWGLRPTSTGLSHGHHDEHKIVGRMLEAVIGQKDLLNRLGRYEAHLQRQIERTLHRLGRVRVPRRGT